MAGHLMGALKQEPEHFEAVGVGSMVVYQGRNGEMRMGRSEFPALVLHQHPDDGSLDILVFKEADDILFEQRVMPYREEMPHRCWKPVEQGSGTVEVSVDAVASRLSHLVTQVFGDFRQPDKSVMEHLADFDTRLRAIEKRLPKKGKAAE